MSASGSAKSGVGIRRCGGRRCGRRRVARWRRRGASARSGVGAAARFCGNGGVLTTKSDALSFVSVPFPSDPPGRRSMLDPLGRRGRGDDPRRTCCVASPQPTASIGSPPIGRSTTAPPVAANPPLYVASAMAAWIPEHVRHEQVPARLQDRRRRPGRLSGDRSATRGDVDQLVARQVDRDGARVRDLGELVGRGCPAGHHLRHEHGSKSATRPRQQAVPIRGRPAMPIGPEPNRPCRQGDDEKQDDLTGVPDAIHRRPPGGRAGVTADAGGRVGVRL